MQMRKLTFITSLGVAALSGAIAQTNNFPTSLLAKTWIWDDKLEALQAAPNNHQVLFQDDHVRLVEVTIHAGEKEPLHGHRYPSVFAYDAPQPALENELLGGQKQDVARNLTGENDLPFCRTMPVQGPHSITIKDTFQQHFYRLEFKRIDGKAIMEKP